MMLSSRTGVWRLLLVCSILYNVRGTKEQTVDADYSGLGTTCDGDETAVGVCMACANLPANVAMPLNSCCTDDVTYSLCKNCIRDVDRCVNTALEIEKALMDMFYDFDYDENELFDFNKPFTSNSFQIPENDLNRNFDNSISSLVNSEYDNIFSIADFAKRDFDKRYGRLFMTSKNRKRAGQMNRIFRKIYTGK